ncbi:MAG: hypothetical protein ACRC2T_13340 [Thermoguttaceae bacterium]
MIQTYKFATNSLVVAIITLLFSVGCSNNVKVSGKVLLDNGDPVTKGLVIFENEKVSGTSDIKSDGSYNIGLTKPGEGIPPGTYAIAIQATGTMSQAVMGGSMDDPIGGYMPQVTGGTSQVDRKYETSRTSGLTITVEKGKKMQHDITVSPPFE